VTSGVVPNATDMQPPVVLAPYSRLDMRRLIQFAVVSVGGQAQPVDLAAMQQHVPICWRVLVLYWMLVA
jgi:hypothetical protein